MNQHELHDYLEDIPSNESGNRPFEEVLSVNMGRRNLLKAGATLAGGAAFGFSAMAQSNSLTLHNALLGFNEQLIGFTSVTRAQGAGPNPAISPEYNYSVVFPWGDPIKPSGPAYGLPMTSSKQEQQIGIGHDGMWYFPILDPNASRFGWDALRDSDPWTSGYLSESGVAGYGDLNGVLCLNHEFGTNAHILRKANPESLEDVRISQLAHGMSVLHIKSVNGVWTTQESALSRRIHVNTPVEFSGPAKNHPMLQNTAMNEPMGTANNCANGYTPWGTYLTCEENFNGYFGTDDTTWKPSSNQSRYGFSSGGFGYSWHKFDPRFDLANPAYANEHNRFGWVVEVDPFAPNAKPIKRTALGRRKNEGATVTVAADGRAVVYMGDDERFDYVFKFVSAEPWQKMRASGESPLDRGTLYAAKFNDNGTGDWLELSMANPKLAAAFSDLGALLVMSRAAADLAGATPMDRPEWVTVAPDGRVYLACTNNSRRTATSLVSVETGRSINRATNAANPTPVNNDGHIIRWVESRGHSGNKFEWDIIIFAKDTHGSEASFASPDGIWADPDGRIFVQTDGDQKDGLQNQMLVGDPVTGVIKRLFTGVPGCEITGITVTPNRKTMFINVQHPGDGDPAASSFPAARGSGAVPRDATVVITKKDGGIIGS